MKAKKQLSSWSSLFLLTFLAVYLYVFNEWLFTATKPSYMNDLGLLRQLQIFFTISALLTSLCFLILLPLTILSLVPFLKRHTNILIKLGTWLPAAVFASLILIMVDNFTYTIFKVGIVSTDGWSRGLYGVGFVVVIVLCYRRLLIAIDRLNQKTRIMGFSQSGAVILLVAILLISLALLISPERIRAASLPITNPIQAEQLPHILLVTADGVSATHTSLDGYTRDTTPRLMELTESSLVAENALANSDHSTGSIISIYTGKYPAKTRLFFAHNILKGQDAYEHLPGILRSQGYKTVQITVPYYLDPASINLLDGFDEVRMTGVIHSRYLNKMSKVLPSDKALFIDESMNRIIDRLRHIFFIEKMNNPRLLAQSDIERWEILRQELRNAQGPLFVHIHLVVTHGKRFNPEEQIYSTGMSIEYQEPWNVDFYDDSILDFDKNVGELVIYLTKLGLLEKTVLIIGSDHSQQWNQQNRIPLLIRFPHGEYAGRIQANVQNLDIAPTVLDYIGLQPPDWMPGRSLIAGEIDQRPLFNVAAIFDGPDSDADRGAPIQEIPTSPVQGIKNVTLVYCQKWFNLDLTKMSWETGDVEGSTSVCQPGNEITDEQAFQWIIEHLKENGLDVSQVDHLRPWEN